MKEIYKVLSGAMGLEKQLDVIANNLANVNTPGFKKSGVAFNDYYAQALDAASGTKQATAADQGAKSAAEGWPPMAVGYQSFTQGAIGPTGRDLDVAIEGDGFFNVEMTGESQPVLTRAGNFSLGVSGELMTAGGRRVLDSSGNPITIDPTAGKISILQDGTVMAGKTTVGQLSVVNVADQTKLQPIGEGLFRVAEGVTPAKVESPRLLQGTLEGSNVQVVDEMVRMIQTERAYQVHQKAMQAVDDLTSKRIEATNG